MPVPAKVNAFQREVGRNEGIASRKQAQHGAVVSDPGQDGAIPTASAPMRNRGRHAADLGDQFFFGERHAPLLYRRVRDAERGRWGSDLLRHFSYLSYSDPRFPGLR